MNTGTRPAAQPGGASGRPGLDGYRQQGRELSEDSGRGPSTTKRGSRARVFVAAENRLLQDALSRMLARQSDVEVVGKTTVGRLDVETLRREGPDILLVTTRGVLARDLAIIRDVRAVTPEVQILLLGGKGDEAEFLQYVRAGIKGYLLREASADDVLGAISALRTGQAVCPGSLCALLFRYCERQIIALPSAAVHQRLGLTRREQQLIPFIAQGLTNKEIANHFCLSEQTVKNHLYRMKHKVGADDRLGIVQVCRTEGFLV